MFNKKNISLPLILTLSRLIISPIIMPVMIFYLLPMQSIHINQLITFVFAVFALTDFFDGFFARRLNKVSVIGKILDPIADKLLVNSSLMALLAIQRIPLMVVLIIVLREFIISGIRLVALEQGFDIVVSLLGKLKTAFQLLMIITLMLNTGHCIVPYFIELGITLITLYLTIYSGLDYSRKFLQQYHYS